MAIFNKALTPLNGSNYVSEPTPYVDDIFDPLFNSRVKEYYRELYGNGLLGTAAGYADMVDNALTGGQGILGPGMGILSTFGRSMDKADDFILGGLTEGVNVVGNVLGGSNPVPSNPLENIFVNDEDYTGTKLLAAMGNSMARLAGGVQLDESDFTTLGDRTAGTVLDLGTDPGILGGKLATLKKGTPVGDVGQILSDYDDYMANVAGNMAFPGGKMLAKKGIDQIHKALAQVSGRPFKDVTFVKGYEFYKTMADDYAKTAKINPIDDPESFMQMQEIESQFKNFDMPDDVSYTSGVKFPKPKEDFDGIEPTKPKKIYVRKPKTPRMERPEVLDIAKADEALEKAYDSYNASLFDNGSKEKIEPYFQEYYANDANLKDMIFHSDGSVNEDMTKDLAEYMRNHIDSVLRIDPEAEDTVLYLADSMENGTFDEDALPYIEMYFPNASKALDASSTAKSNGALPYMAYTSTAGVKAKTASLVQDAINARVMEFMQNYPKVFDRVRTDTHMHTANDISVALKEHLKTYLPVDDPYMYDDSKEGLLRTVNYMLEHPKDPMGIKTVMKHHLADYINYSGIGVLTKDTKLSKGDAIYNYLVELQKELLFSKGLAKTGALDSLDKSKLMALPALEDRAIYNVIKDDPSLNMFKMFRGHSKTSSLKGTYDEYLDGWKNLVAYVGANGKYLQDTPFGRDLYAMCEDINKHVLPYSTNKDFSIAINPIKGIKFKPEMMVPDLKHYHKFRNDFSNFDTKLRPGAKVALNATAVADPDFPGTYKFFRESTKHPLTYDAMTTQGLALFSLYDDYGKQILSNPEVDSMRIDATTIDRIINRPSYSLRKVKDGNEWALKSFLRKIEIDYPLVYAGLNKREGPLNLWDVLMGPNKEYFMYKANLDLSNLPIKTDYLRKQMSGMETNSDGVVFATDADVLNLFTIKETPLPRSDDNLIKKDLTDMIVSNKEYVDYVASGAEAEWEQYDTDKLDAKYLNDENMRQYESDVEAFKLSKSKYAKSKEKYEARVAKKLATLNPETYSQYITSPIETKFEDSLINSVFGNMQSNWHIPSSVGGFDNFEQYITRYGKPEERRFFTLLKNATSANIVAKTKSYKDAWGTYADDAVKASKTRFEQLASKLTPDEVEEYLIASSKKSDQVISGKDMLRYIVNSGGFVTTRLPKGSDLAETLKQAIQSNIDKVNKASKFGDILEYIELEDGTIGYKFATGNKNVAKAFKRVEGGTSMFFEKDLGLSDMVFYKGDPTLDVTFGGKYKELDDAFAELRDIANGKAKMMGETEFSDNYVKYVMQVGTGNPGGEFFDAYRSMLGVDANNSLVADTVREWDDRAVFGSPLYNRAYLGDLDMYKTKDGHIAFSTDLNEIHASTLTKGMFEDNDTQTFFGMFTGDAFRLQSNFANVNELKKVLFAKDDTGKFVGNLDAMSIVSPRYNEGGKLIGFTRYDKLSNEALQKAMEDPNAVFLPDSMWAKLDRLCKKRVRMSSRLARLLQKYVTVPFKMGTLANPGFIVGNMQDAYFKQASLMARKYGTSLDDELANVGIAMKQTIDLNNKFVADGGVFDKYCEFLKSEDAGKVFDKTGEKAFKKSIFAASNGTLNPAVVMGNQEYLTEWVKFLNGNSNLTPEENSIARLYTFVNNFQNVAEFNNNNLDLEDAFESLNLSKYDVPDNVVDRIFYGDPSKGDGSFNTWGLFVNNPVSNRILKSSNQVETWMRTTCIFNDLYHRGYSVDDICEMLGNTGDAAVKETLRVEMLNAINAMHAANFDYDNVSPLMDKMSYILPFPTFYLKNVGYWLDMVIERPQLIDNVISLHSGMWSGKDTKHDEFAAEAKGRGAIPIGIGNKHLTGIAKQSPYNSMFGAFNAMNNAKEDFAYRTNPALRPLARHLQDDKDVKYRPYSTDPYEKNVQQNDPNFSKLAYMFHQLNPYDRAMSTFMRTPKRFGNNSWQLSDLSPSMIQPDFSSGK